MQHSLLIDEDVAGGEPTPTLTRNLRPGKDDPYRGYQLGAAYDEMFAADGAVRRPYGALSGRVSTLTPEELFRRQQACENP